jgi:RNA polymerase sigma-70 factor (ECF subfamily)
MTRVELDEDELIQQAQYGDEAAFVELAAKYKPRIVGIASRFGRDGEEVRDLAQEIFVEVWKGMPGYNRSAPFEHWLSRVATNRCFRFLRRHHRRRALEVVGLPGATGDGQDRVADLADDAALRRRDAAEAREVLAVALGRLSPKDSMVIVLREVEGRSVADIARDTGWSEGSVKVRAHRARLKLRTILEDMGEA